MHYVVEASLNQGKPRLRIVDALSGKTRLEWSLVKVNEMLETGEIKQEDFLKPERYGMNLLLKNLFLLSCIEDSSLQGSRRGQAGEWNLSYNIGPK